MAYLLFLFLLLEGTARLLFAIPRLERRVHVLDDLVERRAWVKRHEETGVAVNYSFDMFDPSLGWRTRPNIRGMTVFGDRVLNSNAQGFRGKRNFKYEKTPGKPRILILGDSYTFGDEVSDVETYAHVLEELLPNAEVMNFGTHGYGHDQMLILLREEGMRYHPDIVLLGFVSIGMPRNLLGFKDYAKPRFRLDQGRLIREGTRVPTPQETLRGDWMRLRIVELYSVIRYRFTRRDREREIKRMTTALLSEIVRVSDSAHAKPLFVYLPLNLEIGRVRQPTSEEQWFFDMCDHQPKLRCLSTLPAFNERLRAGVDFGTTFHYSAAGHRVVAGVIARYLLDSGYVRP